MTNEFCRVRRDDLTELPIIKRVWRIDDLGFHVEIWDWTRHDLHGTGLGSQGLGRS
jgi:hypothetical protein